MEAHHRPSLRRHATVVAAVVLLYAIAIVEPEFKREAFIPRGGVASAEPKAAASARVKHVERRHWRGHALSSLDREAFLHRFSRLAGEELVPCLRGEFGVTGRISLLARLSKQGRLTAVRLILPLKAAPACVGGTIRAMTFEELGARLIDDSVEIEWQFAWQ